MKNEKRRGLVLNKETLTRLTDRQLREAAGGRTKTEDTAYCSMGEPCSGGSGCNTTSMITCVCSENCGPK